MTFPSTYTFNPSDESCAELLTRRTHLEAYLGNIKTDPRKQLCPACKPWQPVDVSPEKPDSNCLMSKMFVAFNEMLKNLIDIEYDEAYVVDPYEEEMDPFEWEDQEE